MPETIVDSKFRVLEPLPKLAGRARYRANDLVTSEVGILEHAPLDGFGRVLPRWTTDWLPALRHRIVRFAALPSFVRVLAVGSWNDGPYYVYAAGDAQPLGDLAPDRLPDAAALRGLLVDLHTANAGGDHVLNLRPEYLAWHGDRLVVLPGAWVLPFELLGRMGMRSPYQPPELRHAGLFGATTDGYMLAAVLSALADRAGGSQPEWLPHATRMLALEPERRATPGDAAAALASAAVAVPPAEAIRRSVERLSDVRGAPPAAGERALHEALDAGLQQLAEGQSSVLVAIGPPDGAGIKDMFLRLRERLTFLTERPRVTWIEPLTAWEPRDLVGDGGHVLFVPDPRPEEPQLLPLATLGWERMRPTLVVVGVRHDAPLPAGHDLESWVRSWCSADAVLRTLSVADDALPRTPLPATPAARHLLDLLSVLEVDATATLLRQALPRQETSLPEAIVELERLGHARRQLDAGGWWGTEPRLVLRVLRPDILEERRAALTPERLEELHLLVSHLLDEGDEPSLGHRYLRFHHLFAGGNWEEAAAAAEPLLRGIERRGLHGLARAIHRRLVNSNLVHHVALPRLLELRHRLARWEIEQGRFAEGQNQYERAAERLFAVADAEARNLDLEPVTEMILAHADLLEGRTGAMPALELVHRYFERFAERLTVRDRGRLLTEQAYCEMRLGRFPAAEERCHVALKLLDSRDHPSEVAQIYSVLGIVRWKTSRYDEAEQYLTSCMSLREKTGDKLAVARVYNNLGLLYRTMHRFPEALGYHQKSIDIRQEMGDAEGVARNLVNLGWVHLEMGNFGPAEEHALRACSVSDTLGLAGIRALAKGLLGEVYMLRDRMADARTALEDAVDGMRALGDVAELFVNLRKYASLELRCGNLDEAEQRLREAEAYLSGASSPLEEANWHLAQGELRRARGDLRQAALSFEHGGNNLARVGSARRAAEVFLTAAELYHASGVESRARDLVDRSRQLLSREGSGITPKLLVDLEAALGTSAAGPARGAQADLFVDILLRAAATTATAGSDGQALERILQEIRALSGARHVVLIGTDQVPRRESAVLREPGVEPPAILDHPRLVGRALQTLLPFGSDDVRDEKPARPFYVVPIEARERGLGCLYLEWDATGSAVEDAVLAVVRALSQQAAVVLDRMVGGGAAPAAAATVSETPPSGAGNGGFDGIVGRSAARQRVIDFVRQVRDVGETVLLMGENGTGKEVVARAIHSSGTRRDGPFLAINCTAIPGPLWGRELFGNVRGAFTDAHETKKGFFEAAHGGTLLLDEIGDMPPDMQTKFLRVLQDRTITPLGGTEPVTVDVRIIAATNKDLALAVERGQFRSDLYHRLNVLAITLAPLRDRREDIPVLANHFLNLHASTNGVRPKKLSGEALRIMMRYRWPGNVRELENAMKGSLVLSTRETLLPEDLPAAVVRGGDSLDTAGELSVDDVAKWVIDHAAFSDRIPLMPVLERALARQMVAKVNEKTRAAKLLGVSKPTLYTRLK
jgi:DNA-binding NtrC family response regulator/tetratricopeptide (TPR) repeat protein